MNELPSRQPLPLPVRVLVKGASTVNWTSFMGGPRTDMTYPRVIEANLLAWGRPAVVRDTSFSAELTKAALSAWQYEVVPWSPDVVVLHYGHMECLHLFLPRDLQAHAQSMQYRRGRLRDPYRRLIRRSWRLLTRAQQRIDRRIPLAFFARRQRRVKLDLDLLVERIRSVGSPMVLLMEIDPPGEIYRTWFPGIAARVDLMNDTLRQVVRDSRSPDVRLFPTTSVLSPLVVSGQLTNADGAHYTPAAHRLIGQALAREIETWVELQGHLDHLSDSRSQDTQETL